MSEGLTIGVLGNGGRESAMAAVYAQSDQVREVIGFGLNPGVDNLEKGRSIDVKPGDIDSIVRAVDENGIDALFVGPEKPLILGVVNRVEAWAAATGKVVVVLGPRMDAAIERSKIEQRLLWEELGLNGVEWRAFSGIRDIDRAIEYVAQKGAKQSVIKPDGQTGGKGVTLPNDQAEAEDTIRAMLSGKIYPGEAERIIIERRASGPEISDTSISDGKGRIINLPATQDHKRLLDTDTEGKDNPNTGGMGSYFPIPASILKAIHRREITRGVRLAQEKMAEQGRSFKGIWYEAEILEGDDVRRLEINVRGGDSETETILWGMTHAGIDVFELYYSAARGELSFTQEDIPQDIAVAAVTLTCAAEGYATGKQVAGDEIFGLDKEYGDNVHIDLAGVAKEDGRYYTNGGRVLYVTGVGHTVDEAAAAAYGAIRENGVNWRGMIVRNTIAKQALNRK